MISTVHIVNFHQLCAATISQILSPVRRHSICTQSHHTNGMCAIASIRTTFYLSLSLVILCGVVQAASS